MQFSSSTRIVWGNFEFFREKLSGCFQQGNKYAPVVLCVQGTQAPWCPDLGGCDSLHTHLGASGSLAYICIHLHETFLSPAAPKPAYWINFLKRWCDLWQLYSNLIFRTRYVKQNKNLKQSITRLIRIKAGRALARSTKADREPVLQGFPAAGSMRPASIYPGCF